MKKTQIERLFENAEKDDNRPSGKLDRKELDQRALQRELMDALRKKSELADKVYELTMVVKEKENTLLLKDSMIRELEIVATATKADLNTCQEKLELEQKIVQAVQAEHKEFQSRFMKLQDKLTEVEKDNDDLRQHLLHLKAQAADDINAGIRKTKRGATPAIWPSTVVHQFDAHESDVSALCFSPDGTCLATGGSDKVVKVWTLRPDMPTKELYVCKVLIPSVAVLSGSKASIMSVQFDPQCKVILAASNDNTARLWSISEGRSKHILEGHSGKVLCAKFIADETHKMVTGSHDRTLKIWDLSQKSCIRTLFAGSSCNDIIAGKGMGTSIISGHLDKRIRFWDARTNAAASEIALPGKVTSLDHNPDRQLLLCCSRDDTLRLIDLRQNSIMSTFSTSGFKVGEDWSRACFSPDGQYVAAGSADGSVFVWEVASGRMKSKKEHMVSSVVVCGWHPSGQLFASGDRSKKVILWKR
eukprot:Em0137g8a